MLPLIIGLEGLVLTSTEEKIIQDCQPAGFILFSRNIESCSQVCALTARLRELCTHEPIISIDQEGGRVIRTAALGLEQPSASALSFHHDVKAVVEHAQITALTLRMLGINLNFAPVLDLDQEEVHQNALSSRCWGTSVNQVISMAGIYNSNLLQGGILTCGKHFPGLGRAKKDPHFSLPSIAASLDDFLCRDLIPFTALMPVLPSIMIAHFLMPELDRNMPSSLSRPIVTDLLRNQLGYGGAVFTDDLCMQAIMDVHSPASAVIHALHAGCDLPLVCHNVQDYIYDIVSALEDMKDTVNYDRESRIMALIQKLSPPLLFKETEWDLLLGRARVLCGKIGDLNQAVPSSPVQMY